MNFLRFFILYYHFLFHYQFINLCKFATNAFDLFLICFSFSNHFVYHDNLNCSASCFHCYFHFFIHIQAEICCLFCFKFCFFYKFQVLTANLYIHYLLYIFTLRNFRISNLKKFRIFMKFNFVKDLYIFDFFCFLKIIVFLLFYLKVVAYHLID